MIISGLSAAFFMLRVMDEDGQSTSGMAVALAVAAGLFVSSGIPTNAAETFDRAATHITKMADKVSAPTTNAALIQAMK